MGMRSAGGLGRSGPWRVAVVCGGTGGHIYPAVAIAEELLQRDRRTCLLFLGSKRGRELLAPHGFQIRGILGGGLKGSSVAAMLASVLKLPVGCLQAFWLLAHFHPDLVVATGSYVSAPVLVAAFLLRIPRLIQEQNVIPGWTNRLLACLAQRVAVAFEQSSPFFTRGRVRVTGNPVRREFLEGMGAEERETSPPGASPFRLLVFGGSQGAHRINVAMMESLPLLEVFKGQLVIIHQTGESDWLMVKERYAGQGFQGEVHPYLWQMGRHLRDADLILCRAGATTLAELTVCGKPAILVPYPYAANNHQVINARVLEQAGAVVVIDDGKLDGVVLAQTLIDLLENRQRLHRMAACSLRLGRPQAAAAVVDLCEELLTGRG